MNYSCTLLIIQSTNIMRTLNVMIVMTVEVKGGHCLNFLKMNSITCIHSMNMYRKKYYSRNYQKKVFFTHPFRSLKFLNEWLQSMDYDVNFLWHNITVSYLSKVLQYLKIALMQLSWSLDSS